MFLKGQGADEDMRRSKEIILLMSKVTLECNDMDIINYCTDIYDIFYSFTHIKSFFITHYGVSPIIDMLEATQLSFQFPIARYSAKSKVTTAVLKVVNVIMKDCSKCQQLIATMGILPGVIALLEKLKYAIVAKESEEKVSTNNKEKNFFYSAMGLSTFIPLLSSSASTPTSPGTPNTPNSILLNAQPSTPTSVLEQRDDNKYDHMALSLEAGRFIHIMASDSILTMHMLIAAGGLSAVVNMISFCEMLPLGGSSDVSIASLTPEVYKSRTCKIFLKPYTHIYIFDIILAIVA